MLLIVKLKPSVEPIRPKELAPVKLPPATIGFETVPMLIDAAAAGAETIMNGSRHRAILTQVERTPDTAKDRVFIVKIRLETGEERAAKW